MSKLTKPVTIISTTTQSRLLRESSGFSRPPLSCETVNTLAQKRLFLCRLESRPVEGRISDAPRAAERKNRSGSAGSTTNRHKDRFEAHDVFPRRVTASCCVPVPETRPAECRSRQQRHLGQEGTLGLYENSHPEARTAPGNWASEQSKGQGSSWAKPSRRSRLPMGLAYPGRPCLVPTGGPDADLISCALEANMKWRPAPAAENSSPSV
jgi:hypothetical protein